MSLTAEQQFAQQDAVFMTRALELAQQAQAVGEVPVGAVVVYAGEVVGSGFNQPISKQDPTAHAEIVALRAAAGTIGNYRLPGSTLYVTIEPCLMCCGALIHARIERLVFAAPAPKTGAVVSVAKVLDDLPHNHQIVVSEGILREQAIGLVQQFFASKR